MKGKLEYLKPVSFNVYKKGRKTKLNPNADTVVEQKRGLVIGWQKHQAVKRMSELKERAKRFIVWS